MIAFMKQYWWGKVNEAFQSAYHPEKSVPANAFYTTSPLMYKYILVMVCVFSHWTKAFFCRQANPSSAGKDDLSQGA